MSATEGNGAADGKGVAEQAARALADETKQNEQPTDRPVPEFEIVGVGHVQRAASPTLSFELEATETTGRSIYTIALTAMVEIEPSKRRYEDAERGRLVELFGEPERWASTTSALRWAQAEVLVPSFTGSTRFQLELPCTYDHEVGATRYFNGLAGGEAPLRIHFNGTIFYADDDGRMQLTQVPWDCSSRFSMPVAVWREMMEAHYPFRGWVALDRTTVERLEHVKAERALPTIDATVAELLDEGTNSDA
ncbi:MAG: DUF6084 family protein [Solirubrobacterales bacterium]